MESHSLWEYTGKALSRAVTLKQWDLRLGKRQELYHEFEAEIKLEGWVTLCSYIPGPFSLRMSFMRIRTSHACAPVMRSQFGFSVRSHEINFSIRTSRPIGWIWFIRNFIIFSCVGARVSGQRVIIVFLSILPSLFYSVIAVSTFIVSFFRCVAFSLYL